MYQLYSYLFELTFALAGASLTIISSGILSIIGWCLIYHKIGEPAYIPVIPIYNSYYQFKKFWDPGKFWLTLVLVLIMIISSVAMVIGMAVENELVIIGSLLAICLIIFIIWILSVILKWKQAQYLSPNNGFLVFLGLFFVAPIFIFIYGIIYEDKVHRNTQIPPNQNTQQNQNNQNNQSWNN